MTLKQSILLSFAILGLVCLLLALVFGEQGLADLRLLKKKHQALILENRTLAVENISLHNEIYRLKNDPEYIESVARSELGMIGRDEVIFKMTGLKDQR